VSAADRTPRAFAALLRVYPRDARARFGDAMRYAWQQDLDRARAAGTLALAGFWIATTADALRFGIAERLSRVSLRPALTVDWRDASRALRAAPLVSTFAVLSLALGIVGVTALFSILNSITLKPLPVREPGRVVLLDGGSWTNPIWEAIRDRQAGIADGAFAWAPIASTSHPPAPPTWSKGSGSVAACSTCSAYRPRWDGRFIRRTTCAAAARTDRSR